MVLRCFPISLFVQPFADALLVLFIPSGEGVVHDVFIFGGRIGHEAVRFVVVQSALGLALKLREIVLPELCSVFERGFPVGHAVDDCQEFGRRLRFPFEQVVKFFGGFDDVERPRGIAFVDQQLVVSLS